MSYRNITCLGQFNCRQWAVLCNNTTRSGQFHLMLNISCKNVIVRIIVNTELRPRSTHVQDEVFLKTRTDQAGGDVSHLYTGSVQFEFRLGHRLSWGSSWFSSVSPGKVRYSVSKYVTFTSLPNPYSTNPTAGHSMLWHTDRDKKYMTSEYTKM